MFSWPMGPPAILTELSPGDAVLVGRDPAGNSRAVRVGRLEGGTPTSEVMIEAERSGLHPTVFLQEAETVRLFHRPPRTDIVGRPPARSAQTWGSGVVLQPARHLGHVIDEAIEER